MVKAISGWMLFGAALVVAAIGASDASAQNYPSRPIHAIVPVPPAALTDVIARKIAAEVSAKMGQPWIMENKSGANFMPAAEACRHAAGDGYTLCIFTTSTLTFNPYLIENIPYDAGKDFIPIINLGMFTGGLVVSPKLDVKSMDELRKLALAKPGALNFGTYGPSSSANVFREYMNDKWKTNIVEVGYKGANELVSALISGEIQMTWTALGNWSDNPGNSKGTVLVQDSVKRSVKMPDVPTYAEVGFGDYPIHTWMGLFAPRGTPPAIVAQINKVVGEVIKQPEMTQFLVNQVIDPAVSTPEEFAAAIAKERKETVEVLQRFNVPKIK